MKLRIIQIIVGLACTLFFLGLALSRVQLEAVAATIGRADLIWVGAAIFVYAVNLSLRAWRWQIILRPVATISYPSVARALLVGYGLNTIMPARLGELFRAEFVKKCFGLSRIWALTSIVIERLFDGLTVVACLGLGMLLAAATGQTAKALRDVLVMGGALFGLLLLAAVCIAGPRMSRRFARIPGLSRRLMMMGRGFAILRTWRTVEVVALTFVLYLPDALSLWLIVKAVGLTLGLSDTLVLVGAASLSTLVPSGPAFLGTLQFAYALAIEFAGGSRALGIAAATLFQLCVLFPVAVIATGVLLHGSASLLRSILVKSVSNESPTETETRIGPSAALYE